MIASITDFRVGVKKLVVVDPFGVVPKEVGTLRIRGRVGASGPDVRPKVTSNGCLSLRFKRGRVRWRGTKMREAGASGRKLVREASDGVRWLGGVGLGGGGQEVM